MSDFFYSTVISAMSYSGRLIITNNLLPNNTKSLSFVGKIYLTTPTGPLLTTWKPRKVSYGFNSISYNLLLCCCDEFDDSKARCFSRFWVICAACDVTLDYLSRNSVFNSSSQFEFGCCRNLLGVAKSYAPDWQAVDIP